MTKMRTGICAAGFTRELDPVTGLRWVRPVRDFGPLLRGDMTDADGRLVQCGDVITLHLIEARPDPPHVEDWTVDFIHHRPRLLRRLTGEKRACFFPRYLDPSPADVLVDHSRSLCLVRPAQVWARFSLDAYSGKYQARMGFTLPGDVNPSQATGRRGVSVTDLRWRAMGRSWLGDKGGRLALDYDGLCERLAVKEIYLSLGLSRNWQGAYWPLVVGVHAVPDYEFAL